MPPWIVFNEQHSPMYPELFIAMKFKRGSQNRNWAGKAKTAEDYVSANGKPEYIDIIHSLPSMIGAMFSHFVTQIGGRKGRSS